MLPYRGRTPSHHIVPVQLHEGVHPEAAPVLPLDVEVREGAVERAFALTCGLLPAGVALDALNDLRELAGIQGATAQAPVRGEHLDALVLDDVEEVRDESLPCAPHKGEVRIEQVRALVDGKAREDVYLLPYRQGPVVKHIGSDADHPAVREGAVGGEGDSNLERSVHSHYHLARVVVRITVQVRVVLRTEHVSGVGRPRGARMRPNK